MPPDKRSARARILIVDESPPVSRPLAEWLHLAGYETDWAGSVREALLLAQTGRWDAIVLDVGVRAMNGVEFYARMAGSSGRECLPIIFVTEYSRQGLLRSLGRLADVSPTPEQNRARAFLQVLGERLQKAQDLSA